MELRCDYCGASEKFRHTWPGYEDLCLRCGGHFQKEPPRPAAFVWRRQPEQAKPYHEVIPEPKIALCTVCREEADRKEDRFLIEFTCKKCRRDLDRVREYWRIPEIHPETPSIAERRRRWKHAKSWEVVKQGSGTKWTW